MRDVCEKIHTMDQQDIDHSIIDIRKFLGKSGFPEGFCGGKAGFLSQCDLSAG